METASTQLKPTEQQRKQDREKSDMKQTLSLSSSVTKKIQTSLDEGYHTVTQDGDLICAYKNTNIIKKITLGNKVTAFIKTRDWSPISIHSSHINGDILVGMIKDEEAKVTRYNKIGEEIQNIQTDNTELGLYEYPHYITENINGDICTSDLGNYAVGVVNKSGQYRFSYSSQEICFYPHDICTDHLGHIIVCDPYNYTIDILHRDGQFLSRLFIEQQEVKYPRGLCVDDENNLHVGQSKTNTVTVYKYLHLL
uniref:Tripartite motif-containing protein 2 n=1 Tax=Magallana gigas TaxID=29159 RepID=K1RLS2_MAGGI